MVWGATAHNKVYPPIADQIKDKSEHRCNPAPRATPKRNAHGLGSSRPPPCPNDFLRLAPKPCASAIVLSSPRTSTSRTMLTRKLLRHGPAVSLGPERRAIGTTTFNASPWGEEAANQAECNLRASQAWPATPPKMPPCWWLLLGGCRNPSPPTPTERQPANTLITLDLDKGRAGHGALGICSTLGKLPESMRCGSAQVPPSQSRSGLVLREAWRPLGVCAQADFRRLRCDAKHRSFSAHSARGYKSRCFKASIGASVRAPQTMEGSSRCAKSG